MLLRMCAEADHPVRRTMGFMNLIRLASSRSNKRPQTVSRWGSGREKLSHGSDRTQGVRPVFGRVAQGVAHAIGCLDSRTRAESIGPAWISQEKA